METRPLTPLVLPVLDIQATAWTDHASGLARVGVSWSIDRAPVDLTPFRLHLRRCTVADNLPFVDVSISKT